MQGYRPTREQLEELLELAQRGIDHDPAARLVYLQGREEIYAEKSSGKILPGDFGQVVKDAGDPRELNNLYFSISQVSPVRRVEIEIGPGEWTWYVIESDDQTWAHGRYHEITEKLLVDRSLYAKSHSSTPQVPGRGTDNWHPAPWELTPDWRVSAVDYVNQIVRWVLGCTMVAEIGTILVSLSYYHATYTDPEQAKNDRYAANMVLEWFKHNTTWLLLLNLGYIFLVVMLNYWMKTFLSSRVILQDNNKSLLFQLGLQGNRDNLVNFAMLWLAFFSTIIGVVGLVK